MLELRINRGQSTETKSIQNVYAHCTCESDDRMFRCCVHRHNVPRFKANQGCDVQNRFRWRSRIFHQTQANEGCGNYAKLSIRLIELKLPEIGIATNYRVHFECLFDISVIEYARRVDGHINRWIFCVQPWRSVSHCFLVAHIHSAVIDSRRWIMLTEFR